MNNGMDILHDLHIHWRVQIQIVVQCEVMTFDPNMPTTS